MCILHCRMFFIANFTPQDGFSCVFYTTGCFSLRISHRRTFFVVYFTLQDVFTLRISHRRTFLVVYFTLQDVFTLRISHRRAFFRCGFYIRMFLHCAVSLQGVFTLRGFAAGCFSLCIRCYVARFASNSYTKYNKISLNNVLLVICTGKSQMHTTWSTHHEPHMYTTRHTTLTLCHLYSNTYNNIYYSILQYTLIFYHIGLKSQKYALMCMCALLRLISPYSR